MDQVLTKRLPTEPVRREDGTFCGKPLTAVWELTLRCNQACRFCGTRAGLARRNELTTAEAIDVVEQLAELGTREIALHGGEAYLRPDWLEIARAASSRGIDVSLVTGGRGLSADLARDARAAGLTSVAVSIDGVEATHDRLRGSAGSFASAIQAVRTLQDAGIPTGCNTQLNAQNFRELPELTEVLLSLGLYGWQVQLMVPMGRAADDPTLWLQPYDLLELVPLVARARQACDAAQVNLWPGDNLGYFGPYEHALRTGRSFHGHCSGCGGGLLCIGIEAHGDVKGCSAMTSEGFIAGNVRSHRLRELWDTAPELRYSRDFRLDDLWGFCRTCYYAEECKGGCMWTASTILGRRGNNPYCHHRALEMLARDQRERLRLVRGAPGEVRDRALFELDVEPAPAEWVVEVAERSANLSPKTTQE